MCWNFMFSNIGRGSSIRWIGMIIDMFLQGSHRWAYSNPFRVILSTDAYRLRLDSESLGRRRDQETSSLREHFSSSLCSSAWDASGRLRRTQEECLALGVTARLTSLRWWFWSLLRSRRREGNFLPWKGHMQETLWLTSSVRVKDSFCKIWKQDKDLYSRNFYSIKYWRF